MLYMYNILTNIINASFPLICIISAGNNPSGNEVHDLSIFLASVAYLVVFLDYSFNLTSLRWKLEDKEKTSTITSIVIYRILIAVFAILMCVTLLNAGILSYEIALFIGLNSLALCFNVPWLFIALEKLKFYAVLNAIIKISACVGIYINDLTDFLSLAVIIVSCNFLTSFLLILKVGHNKFQLKSNIHNLKKMCNEGKELFLSILSVSIYRQLFVLCVPIIVIDPKFFVGFFFWDRISRSLNLFNQSFSNILLRRTVTEKPLAIEKWILLSVPFFSCIMLLIFGRKIFEFFLPEELNYIYDQVKILTLLPVISSIGNYFGNIKLLSDNQDSLFRKIIMQSIALSIPLLIIIVFWFPNNLAIYIVFVELLVVIGFIRQKLWIRS